jgi:hypothetical protein
VHNMACFFYLVGTGDESLNDDEQTIISGWVAQEVRIYFCAPCLC